MNEEQQTKIIYDAGRNLVGENGDLYLGLILSESEIETHYLAKIKPCIEQINEIKAYVRERSNSPDAILTVLPLDSESAKFFTVLHKCKTMIVPEDADNE